MPRIVSNLSQILLIVIHFARISIRHVDSMTERQTTEQLTTEQLTTERLTTERLTTKRLSN